MANRYRKRPVVVEALQWDGTNWSEVCEFLGVPENGHGDADTAYYRSADDQKMDVIIHTLEGDMSANLGDYIIKGVQGEFYPCKPDIFEMTYDLVEDEDGITIIEDVQLLYISVDRKPNPYGVAAERNGEIDN